jgi:hypothetical protein
MLFTPIVQNRVKQLFKRFWHVHFLNCFKNIYYLKAIKKYYVEIFKITLGYSTIIIKKFYYKKISK